jgi:S-adenosyl methyltransferase
VLLRAHGRGQLRDRDEITRLFDGFELVPPGVVHLVEWRPDEPVRPPLGISEVLYLGGLARKP